MSTAWLGCHLGCGWLQLAPALEEGSRGHKVSQLQTQPDAGPSDSATDCGWGLLVHAPQHEERDLPPGLGPH